MAIRPYRHVPIHVGQNKDWDAPKNRMEQRCPRCPIDGTRWEAVSIRLTFVIDVVPGKSTQIGRVVRTGESTHRYLNVECEARCRKTYRDRHILFSLHRNGGSMVRWLRPKRSLKQTSLVISETPPSTRLAFRGSSLIGRNRWCKSLREDNRCTAFLEPLRWVHGRQQRGKTEGIVYKWGQRTVFHPAPLHYEVSIPEHFGSCG